MTVFWASAGAMPARSPHLANPLQSLRKLKSALSSPLPRSGIRFATQRGSSIQQKFLLFGIHGGFVTQVSRSGRPKTHFRGSDGGFAMPKIAAESRFRSHGGRGAEEEGRILYGFSPFSGDREGGGGGRSESRSRHDDSQSAHLRELKSALTRTGPRKGDAERSKSSGSSRERELTASPAPSPERKSSREEFGSSRGAFGTNVVGRNNGRGRGGGTYLGNEGSSRHAFGTNVVGRNNGGGRGRRGGRGGGRQLGNEGSSRHAFGTNVVAKNNGRGRGREFGNEGSSRGSLGSSRTSFGTNVFSENNGRGAGGVGKRDLGNEGSTSSRDILGFGGDEESDLMRDQRREEFENWALEKFREAGTSALPAIEEMRQTFAPGSPRLGPHLIPSASEPGRHIAIQRNPKNPQTVNRSSFMGSLADARKSGMTPSANGGYGSSRVDHRVSSPTSRFGAGRSEQHFVARSSARSESWSPMSSGPNRGSRSASNVASRTGVQFPSEESGKTARGESGSAGKSGGESISEPLIVKRKIKFPINFHGKGGTVMLVDKPKGWTSFAVCGKLRYLLKIQKVGHAGTLDPMATGLLIVCLGKATKLADSYQAMTKVYSGTLRLGELTPSLDADTEVSDVLPWEHITDDQLEQAKQAFLGDIFQTPPMFSAIKIDGERLYEKARRGEQIEIPSRLVTVNNFQLERSSENRQDIHFKVTCSKGTYIRSLCADLGRALGSYAHLIALRREKIGTYSVKDAWPILEFVEQYSQGRVEVPIQAKT